MADQNQQAGGKPGNSGNSMRPASAAEAPDPSRNYERSRPEDEAGMGRLDNNSAATPARQPDGTAGAVPNKQDPNRQLNAHDVVNSTASAARPQPDHSMLDEEPDGWDQAPLDIQNPEQKRHPRQEGKGGTP